jgi:uncharacterized membrane protein YhiD involved in acid resistance
MDTTISPFVGVVLTIIGLIITVSIPVVGFSFKQLYGRINEVKEDAKEITRLSTDDYKERVAEAKREAKQLVMEEERRRNDAIGGVMTQVNSHYADLKNEMHNIRSDIKDLRDDK